MYRWADEEHFTWLYTEGSFRHTESEARRLTQPRRAIAESGDHSGTFVPGDRRRPATTDAIGPGRRPRQLIPGESRRMNLNNDVVYGGPLYPAAARVAVAI